MSGHSSSALPFQALRRTRRRGDNKTLHDHAEAQLIFAASGTMQVYTETGRWLVPPQLAVWAPAGVRHKVDILSDIELWSIYWHPSAYRSWTPARSFDHAFALKVTPLLRELISAAFATEGEPKRAELIAKLILYELTETPDAPTFLPWPSSVIGRRIADLAIADTRMQLDVDDVASRAATSTRTMSRLFRLETGMTLKTWRQRARIVLAIERLYSGDPVARLASDAGFASTAAFCFAFRQVTGMTPTAFIEASPLRKALRRGTPLAIVADDIPQSPVAHQGTKNPRQTGRSLCATTAGR